MMGLDKEFALLKRVRADLSVKWKTIDAEEIQASEAFLARQNYAFAYVN